MCYRLMIYNIAILSASFIAVWGNAGGQQQCQTGSTTSNAVPFETALAIARCYSICADDQVRLVYY